MQSYEPGEDWFWDFERSVGLEGPRLADPQSHPDDQPVPGPAGRVPEDWRAARPLSRPAAVPCSAHASYAAHPPRP